MRVEEHGELQSRNRRLALTSLCRAHVVTSLPTVEAKAVLPAVYSLFMGQGWKY